MKPSLIKLFVKCWTAEYAASEKVNEINDAIDECSGTSKPTTGLYQRLDKWIIKQYEACQPLNELIASGELPEDAADICQEQLGDLRGYVSDCYHDVYIENQTA